MQVNGKNYHTIWVHPTNKTIVQVIDQRKIPFEFQLVDLKTPADTFEAIKNMTVRGAPLIGVTGAYGIYLGLIYDIGEDWKHNLSATRITLNRHDQQLSTWPFSSTNLSTL